MNQAIVFQVSGIKCGGCEATISKALQSMVGVVSVQASSLDKTVRVQFDAGQTSDEAIKSAIEAAGYTVQDNE